MNPGSFRRIAIFLFSALILLVACGAVPLTGRKQILLVSDWQVLETGLSQYRDFMDGASLSSDKKSAAMVKSVGKKLAAATESYLKANGFASEVADLSWEFNLVRSGEVNAFCMPGGKIVIYEGLMGVVSNEAELAAVLGHEIAHAVAKHSNERLSQQMLVQFGMDIVSAALSEKSAAIQLAGNVVFGLGAQVGIMLPYSRKHEYEADYMGMVFMEMAGYDSSDALNFWTRMSERSGSSNDFFSTHPSDAKRIKQIRKRLQEAKSIAEKY